MKDNKKLLFEEGLKKFNYRVNYKVNESPKYRPLVGMDEEFDELPLTNEAGEQEDAPKPAGGEVPPAPSNDQPIGVSPTPPVPEFDKGNTPPMDNMPLGDTAMPSTEEKVDDIQNEIIKHNIEAMKSIHDQLKSLNDMTLSLNSKMGELTADVQEVREPTNAEKLMNKAKVSYPYYFNLNDFWSGNWFNQQRSNEKSRGIEELPDGTFVADFDELPQQSKTDIQNSFNDIA